MNASITVEFLIGTPVETAIAEARSMAQRLQLAYVKFEFNGVSVSIGQHANVEAGTSAIMKAVSAEHGYVVENGK